MGSVVQLGSSSPFLKRLHLLPPYLSSPLPNPTRLVLWCPLAQNDRSLMPFFPRQNQQPLNMGTAPRAFPSLSTLEKWKDVLKATTDWMADLGPPLYVVSEDTSPNVTLNPAFKLAYWRFGLGLAEAWFNELREEVPRDWTTVKTNLAPLPIQNKGTLRCIPSMKALNLISGRIQCISMIILPWWDYMVGFRPRKGSI
ncbi:MAG: hypothetical protein NXY57DRAFT_1029585 [Lentinula lateritia]|nr:MAG: hypothetical protein NXY57DRAFT_1029585 [Lentinula lateritia]